MLIAFSIGDNDIDESIALGAEKLGHEVIKFYWESENEVLNKISNVDVAFLPVHRLLKSPFCNKTFIEKLNNCKCNVVLTIVDEPRIVSRVSSKISPYYKRMIWPHTLQCLDSYSNCEKLILEPIMGEPFWYSKQDIKKEYDVVFNGSIYSFRIDFLKALTPKLEEKGVNFKILSRYKDIGISKEHFLNHSNQLLSHAVLNKIYNQSKILLLFGSFADAMDHYSEEDLKNIDSTLGRSGGYPCRFSSFAGSGEFILADKRKETNRYFEEGSEIVTYNSIDECVEKIEYFLSYDEEREKIAKAGHERYLKDHTIDIRIQKVLETIMSDTESLKIK